MNEGVITDLNQLHNEKFLFFCNGLTFKATRNQITGHQSHPSDTLEAYDSSKEVIRLGGVESCSFQPLTNIFPCSPWSPELRKKLNVTTVTTYVTHF